MEHHFNTSVASVYGVVEAVIIHNLYFWTKKNEANRKHFHDGRYWSYNSARAMAELFPYLTEKQISYTMDKLVKSGAIHKANYNETAYDRTLWYALDASVISLYQDSEMKAPENVKPISQNCKMDNPKMDNGIPENVTPIPDSKPIINTDNSVVVSNAYAHEGALTLKTGKEKTATPHSAHPPADEPIIVDDLLLAKHYQFWSKEEFNTLAYYYGGGMYPHEMITHFIGKWTQQSGQKPDRMAFQEQTSWDMAWRLRSWHSKQTIFEPQKPLNNGNAHQQSTQRTAGSDKKGTSAKRVDAIRAFVNGGKLP